MRLLLDTATFIWLAEDSSELGVEAARLIADPANKAVLSAASAWEIAIKHRLGRLALKIPPDEYVPLQRRLHLIDALPVCESAALQVSKLPDLHRDPFDRMLIAQAIVGGYTILTPDEAIRNYPVPVRW